MKRKKVVTVMGDKNPNKQPKKKKTVEKAAQPAVNEAAPAKKPKK